MEAGDRRSRLVLFTGSFQRLALKHNFTLSDNIVIGQTDVVLLAKRGEETNLGDFIADSMVYWVNKYVFSHNNIRKNLQPPRTIPKAITFFRSIPRTAPATKAPGARSRWP